MKKANLLILLLFLSFANKAQTLPIIAGETLEDKKMILPVDTKGKFTLLCFASSQKAQPDLESWLDPVYQKFIAKTGMMDDMYDVNVFFVPILTGTNISFATSMKNKFRENTQEDLRKHVIFCTEKGKDILASLEMKNTDTPLFLLLDKEGKIIYRTNGKYAEEKFDAIDELIED